MRSLRFETLELLSFKERKARKIEFHPRLTVINGANDVGKSSVIKSIYWAFGADPKSVHKTWRDAKVRALLTFTVDGIRHSVLRFGKSITIFDADYNVLLSTRSVTAELAPYLAELLNFRLVLASRGNKAETPPPAFAFLPFYVNQEASWEKPFAAFDRLGQYPDFKNALIDFHSGILGNEYYELDAERKRVEFEKKELERDQKAVSKAVERLGLEASFTGLELTAETHEASVERLLAHLREIRVQRLARTAKLAELVDLRTSLDSQVKVAKRAMRELESDAVYAGTLDEEVYCPVCNTRHENDFAKRYGILDDREACLEFMADARETMRGVAGQVRNLEADIRGADGIIEKIQETLAERRGDVSLREVIASEGQRTAGELLRDQLDEIIASAGLLEVRSGEIKAGQKELKDPARREEIESFYAGKMVAFLRLLDVSNYDPDEVVKINGRIVETGSDQPRAILAYDLALLHTIHKFGQSFTAPMVIDSPNQQDQDDVNVRAMIKLIVGNIPNGGQMVLGSVDMHGVDAGDAKIIEFHEKLSVLTASEFDAVNARMAPLIQKIV